MWTRWDFVRSTFSRYHPPINLVEKCALPSRVYIVRRPTDHPNRIVNVEEVHDYVTQRGFTIIDAEKLNTQQKIALFVQADIVIAEPGSSAFNYFSFAHQNCVLVTIMAATIMTPGEIMLRADCHIVPFLDKTIFAIGQHPAKNNGDYLHFPSTYPIKVVAIAIDQAEEMLNHRH